MLEIGFLLRLKSLAHNPADKLFRWLYLLDDILMAWIEVTKFF